MAAPSYPLPWLNWRSNEAYDYTSGLPRRGWAWEFLRRNPGYQRDWGHLAPAFEFPRTGSHPIVCRLTGELPDLARWGLLFRGLARQGRNCGDGLLASS